MVVVSPRDIGIYPFVFFLRVFCLTKKAMGFPCVWGPKKKPPKGGRSNPHQRAVPCPSCASFEADNLKFLDSIKVFDGLNQKQKDTNRHDDTAAAPEKPTGVECHGLFFTLFFCFPTKKGVEVFFWVGSREWMKKNIEIVWKVQDSILWIYILNIYIYIRIRLNGSNFILSRFLRPAMLAYLYILYGMSND